MTKYILDIETNGLDSIKDRITCITLLEINNDIPTSFYGENEKNILEQFWNSIKSAEEIIYFNGDGFDLPFLIKRSLINNVRISDNFSKIKFIDLRKTVNSFFSSYNKYEKGSLNDWANILNIEIKTENGLKMLEFYEKKNWKAIREHCEEDVYISKLLYERCKNCNLL